ncbi:hypothetical protein B0H14DRAFT_3876912 [Mycena olivaceomarginata]|nr:hypothetical protein B0H14DRAFT_3876912 [Mycena olivaceomarginata]
MVSVPANPLDRNSTPVPSTAAAQPWLTAAIDLPFIALLAGLIFLALFRTLLALRRTMIFLAAEELFQAPTELGERHEPPKTPWFTHTVPAPYQSRTPVSMAQIIMVRHMSRRPHWHSRVCVRVPAPTQPRSSFVSTFAPGG